MNNVLFGLINLIMISLKESRCFEYLPVISWESLLQLQHQITARIFFQFEVIKLLVVLFDPLDINIRDLVFLYYYTASLLGDLLKILLCVRPNLLTRSSLYINFHPVPVSAEKKQTNEEFSVFFFGPTAFLSIILIRKLGLHTVHLLIDLCLQQLQDVAVIDPLFLSFL